MFVKLQLVTNIIQFETVYPHFMPLGARVFVPVARTLRSTAAQTHQKRCGGRHDIIPKHYLFQIAFI